MEKSQRDERNRIREIPPQAKECHGHLKAQRPKT